MIEALKKEMFLSKSDHYLNAETIETIYFGGGTPSLLDKRDIKELLSGLRNNFLISRDPEITLEANPDDINISSLRGWKDAGINRLSIGVQSFIERDLDWMNRVHSAADALKAVNLVKNSGFENYSVDLIYGVPSLTEDEWKQNVEKIFLLGVPHVAAYALTVEHGTALQKMIKLGKKSDVNGEEQAIQFLQLMKWMKEAGYEHYEISNFAKPGFRSQHNSSYWQGKPYLGIGPSAHSFSGKARKWNIANNPLYIQSIKQNIIPFEEEVLTETQQLNEYIMTSLRTSDGLDLKFVEKRFSFGERERIEMGAKKYVNDGRIKREDQRLILTDQGKLFADGIAGDLFNDEKKS